MKALMAVAVLGMAMVVGCDSMKKKDDTTTSDPKKMSVDAKKSDCSSCEGSKAK